MQETLQILMLRNLPYLNMIKNPKVKWKTGVCAVEKYTDGNTKKKKVFFCNQCREWMCRKCSKDVVKRVMALFNKSLNKKVKI